LPYGLISVVLFFGTTGALCAQQVTVVNHYGDTTGNGNLRPRLKSSQTHTIVINYYEPAPAGEIDRFAELIAQSLNFYIDQVTGIENGKLAFRKSRDRVFQDMNDIVKDALRFYQFREIEKFKGFSDRVKDKIAEIDGMEWKKSDFYVKDNNPEVQKQMMYYFAQKELNDLKLLANTEVGYYSNDNLLQLSETAIRALDEDSEKDLIAEIEAFRANDPLEPLEIEFSNATVQVLSGEDEFSLPGTLSNGSQSVSGEPGSAFEARIIELLEQNNRRMEKMEQEIRDIRTEQVLQRQEMLEARDNALQSQIDELRLMVAELIRRPGDTAGGGDKDWSRPLLRPEETGVIYNLPEKVDITFALGSSELDISARLMLNEIISFLAYDPSLSLLITGYADKRGNTQSNLELSRKRSLRVRDYLLAQGISKDRLIMNYFGDRESSGENPEDRKVEVGMVRL